jgi:hypothetical protein
MSRHPHDCKCIDTSPADPRQHRAPGAFFSALRYSGGDFASQRDVFVAHEMDGHSFAEKSRDTAVVSLAIMSAIVFELWNVLMPVIFRLPSITFRQALGLFILSRALFGRFGAPDRKMRLPRVIHGWKDLTYEERQRFSEAMKFHGPKPFGANDITDKG